MLTKKQGQGPRVSTFSMGFYDALNGDRQMLQPSRNGLVFEVLMFTFTLGNLSVICSRTVESMLGRNDESVASSTPTTVGTRRTLLSLHISLGRVTGVRLGRFLFFRFMARTSI